MTHKRAEPIAPLPAEQRNQQEAVWRAVLTAAADRPPLAWVRRLELQTIDERVATVAAGQGGGKTVRFISDRQREQLGELVSQVLGRTVRIELAAGNTANRPTETTGGPDKGVQQEAMSLPLVRKVMETFEDVMLVDVRREREDESDED